MNYIFGTYETMYLRMYQVKIVEESLWKICSDKIFIGCVPQILVCLFLNPLSNI